MRNILIAGGAGYVGSHLTRFLKAKGYAPVVFDNLSTGHADFIPPRIPLIRGDLRSVNDVRQVLGDHAIDAVVYCAGLISIEASVKNPQRYYANNVGACEGLLLAMQECGVRRLVFASSASLYGQPKRLPVTEGTKRCPLNPYGFSQLVNEEMITAMSLMYPSLSYVILRFFNVAGAYPGAIIGEAHKPETHLIPLLLKAARAKQGKAVIFGNNYPTPDGTCVRDYVHVMDLCDAIHRALKHTQAHRSRECINLGSGRGYSVQEVISAVARLTGRRLTFQVKPPRPGDAAVLVASIRKAHQRLGWKPKHDLDEMIQSAWEWELGIDKMPRMGIIDRFQ